MKTPLQHIAFELTDKCNLSCKYCYNIWKIPGAGKHEPFNSYNKAIKTLTEVFKQADVRNVAFTGGEPFIAERMQEVALFCRMEGKSVTMITNGTMGTKKAYKSLLKMGISLFELPIHSPHAEVHDTMTGLPGSWQKSQQSVRELLDLGAMVVAVVVITCYNVEQLGETLDFIHQTGIKRVMLNRYNIGGCGIANPAGVSATPAQLRAAYTVANQKSKELGLIQTSNVCTPTCLLNPADYPRIGFGNCSDDVLRKPITIDVNGNVRLCNHSPIIAGNIFQNHLNDILYSPYANSWNEQIPTDCVDCNWWENCRGGCRAASEQCGLGLAHIDPIMTMI